MSEQVEQAKQAMATEVPEEHEKETKTIHILITQCLQNGFFFSESNRLSLPQDEVTRMLIGAYDDENDALEDIVEENTTTAETVAEKVIQAPKEAAKRLVEQFRKFEPRIENNRRKYDPKDLKNGPLYRFLKTVINKPKRNAPLHVIHIKDWHTLSEQYDNERKLYGGHCEADTWEAEPLDGYTTFLKPWGNSQTDRNKAHTLEGFSTDKYPSTKFYEVLSDSVFDFRPSRTIRKKEEIEALAEDKDHHVSPSTSYLGLILDEIIGDNKPGDDIQVYITVIGVYTDIKIKTLLVGLRSRYDLDNLIVSDVLTAAPTLERQLEALDFIDKVLNVEIVSDLNTIIGILDTETRDPMGKTTEEKQIPQSLTANSIKWRNYRNYYLDKQTVLSYQDKHLANYLKLTTARSRKIYQTAYDTNLYLTWVGRITMGLLLVFLIWNGVLVNIPYFRDTLSLGVIPIEVFVVTGIGTFAQIIPMFFTKPQEQMQTNLMMLVRLQNYLESYSMTSALLRHHLTAPKRLEESSVADLKEQLEAIEQAAKSLQKNFQDISHRPSQNQADEEAAAEQAPIIPG